MLENPKLLYIVVEDGQRTEGGKITSFRYTRSLLQSTLQLMGCKARHAFKISKRVFEVMKNGFPGDFSSSNELDASEQDSMGSSADKVNDDYLGHTDDDENWIISKADKRQDMPFELYKKRTTVTVDRTTFLDVVCESLSTYKYVGPNQRADLILACRIRERKESVTVLLCGTSGCGKSTLSSLLGSRLGITTVVSTDSIRHMMRSFVDEKQNPLLWASTYHAGDYLDPMAVAEAKTKRKAKKLTGSSPVPPKDDDGSSSGAQESTPVDAAACAELIGVKQMAIEGFKAQSEMVIDSLDRLISAWEDRNESVIVEGVHLSLNFVMGLMKKHPSIIPFMIHIANEDKHLERFAVRAKYMTLDPAKNKYVKYIRNIRTIQEYLCNRADKHLVPKINNTNVDRSVAAIHATVFSCLRRRAAGDQLYDPATNTVSVITDEFRNQCAANSLSSKGMFQLIQRKGSSRHLMALLNNDGSVAKVWPLETLDSDKPSSVVRQMSGPLQIGKAEPVNLQFGSFGISAWPGDAAGTSYAVSGDDSKAETAETGSRHLSSCASSPRYSDGPAKELKEELSVSVSEEEAEDITEEDSDEDLSDNEEKNIAEEMEGSVDEDGARSDEEYQDLAIYDEQENGYDTENEEDFDDRNMDGDDDKYQQNLDLFLSSTTGPTNAKCSDVLTSHGRSQSIPALGKYGSLTSEPVLSGALT